MNHEQQSFDALRSDEVFLQAALASDPVSLCRRLSRTDAVCRIAREIESDPSRIGALCSFVEELLKEPHDPQYRHPNDLAICAALTILGTIPLATVRRLIRRLSTMDAPPLAWTRRMAEHCEELFGDRMEPPRPSEWALSAYRKLQITGGLVTYQPQQVQIVMHERRLPSYERPQQSEILSEAGLTSRPRFPDVESASEENRIDARSPQRKTWLVYSHPDDAHG